MKSTSPPERGVGCLCKLKRVASYRENEACEGLKDDYDIKMVLRWHLSTQPAHEEVLKYHITRRKNLKTEVRVT